MEKSNEVKKVATAKNLTERVANVVNIISKFDYLTTCHYVRVMNAEWREALCDYLGVGEDVEAIFNAIKKLGVKTATDEEQDEVVTNKAA